MDSIQSTYTGIPIIVTDKRKQKRRHRKKRINKKWAKRYGYIENNYPYIEDGKAIMFKGKIYINENTYLKLKNNIQKLPPHIDNGFGTEEYRICDLEKKEFISI